jgi:peptide/nickel transport system ATP-binding protein
VRGLIQSNGQGTQQAVLTVDGLTVEYRTPTGVVCAVRDVSFDLHLNESLALIGESGCGKTTLGLALLRLLPKPGRASAGAIRYRKRDGHVIDLLELDRDELRDFRWKECAMVFQGAMNSFNPVLRVWDQMLETVRAHKAMSRDEVRERSVKLLRMVQLEPDRILKAYPHELSGGMRQRVLIAMALLLDPPVMILDEPTTAVDILTQRAIIEVLRSLRQELDFAMIFISHDLALAAELADRVATMYAGRVVEQGDVRDMFYRPRHPYTVGLIKAVPPVVGDLPEIASIRGAPPSLLLLPSGCAFHPRCPYARDRCPQEEPVLTGVAEGHAVACHYWQEVHLQHHLQGESNG